MTAHPEMRSAIDRHFAGRIAPAEEQQMRSHLPDCDDCRGYYDRRLAFANIDPRALSAKERLARGLGLNDASPKRSLSRRTFALAGFATAATAAAVAASIAIVALIPRDSQYRARGTTPPSRIFAYAVEKARVERTSGGRIHATAELAFAYENTEARERLLVFGVDEHRHVYWYHPAWTNAAETPIAVKISTEPGVHELPEAIRHALDGTKLDLYAVFTDQELTVRDIEKRLDDLASLQPQKISLEVTR